MRYGVLFHICPSQYRGRSAVDSAKVRLDVALETPLGTQGIGQGSGILALMYAIDQVIGAHDGLSLPVFDTHPERRVVEFVPSLLVNNIAGAPPIVFLFVPLEVLAHRYGAMALIP
jgi:hypothetical protein